MKKPTKAGNQVGEAFWHMLLAEHGLDLSGVRFPIFVFVERVADVFCRIIMAQTLSNWNVYVINASESMRRVAHMPNMHS